MSQVYSDFILEKQPTTVNETLQIFKDISKNFGNIENHYQYSSPMYAQLIPIKMVSISLLYIGNNMSDQYDAKTPKNNWILRRFIFLYFLRQSNPLK